MGRPISAGCTGAAAPVLQLPVDLLARNAALHRRDDAPHFQYRRIQGLAPRRPWLLAVFSLCLLVYLLFTRFFVPRLATLGKMQADARSLMTGRITDAYTNIATVKLFSHSQRESGYAQSAMADFLKTVFRQMR